MANDSDLQFEKAEFVDPSVARMMCKACQKPIPDVYWQIGDAIVCSTCKVALEQSVVGGSAMWRVMKATLYGGGVGLAGAAVYCGTIWATNYNLALITIFIGIFVGKAVRAGSENRGGLPYQLLALLITYVSMSLAFAPLVYSGLQEIRLKERAERAKKGDPTAAAPKVVDAAARARASASPGAPASPAAKGAKLDVDDAEVPESVQNLVLAGMSVAFALIFPFVQVSSGQIMFLIIFGVGLHEAWKANVKLVFEFQGPLRVAPSIGSAAPATPAAPPDAGPAA